MLSTMLQVHTHHRWSTYTTKLCKQLALADVHPLVNCHSKEKLLLMFMWKNRVLLSFYKIAWSVASVHMRNPCCFGTTLTGKFLAWFTFTFPYLSRTLWTKGIVSEDSFIHNFSGASTLEKLATASLLVTGNRYYVITHKFGFNHTSSSVLFGSVSLRYFTCESLDCQQDATGLSWHLWEVSESVDVVIKWILRF